MRWSHVGSVTAPRDKALDKLANFSFSATRHRWLIIADRDTRLRQEQHRRSQAEAALLRSRRQRVPGVCVRFRNAMLAP
ncbi:MAG: hypothetical protein QOJ29_4441 [Thermoleophilaceae bacterium]|nr:hypothetical protein [Thermoleophilaceae bacterium]